MLTGIGVARPGGSRGASRSIVLIVFQLPAIPLGGSEAGARMRSIYTKAVFDGFNNKTFARPKLKLVYGK